jgi:hypothetical protein
MAAFEVITAKDILNNNKGGVFVPPEIDGGGLPSPEDARYMLEKTAAREWSMRVRGFRDGALLKLEGDTVRYSTSSLYIAEDGATRTPLITTTTPLILVNGLTECRYHAAAQEPEARDDLAVQVLEAGEDGIFDLLETDGEEYHPFARFVYDGAKLGTLATYRVTTDPAFRTESGLGYKQGDPHPVSVEHKGDIFTLEALDAGESLALNAISQRVISNPLLAEKQGSWGDPRTNPDVLTLLALHEEHSRSSNKNTPVAEGALQDFVVSS